MNRTSNAGGGGWDEGRHAAKRRRWNGRGGNGGSRNSSKGNDDAPPPSRGRDLAEKTRGRDDGYGYHPSSDSNDENSCTANGAARSAKSRKPPHRARKEQRIGMRTFRTARKDRDDLVDPASDCDEGGSSRAGASAGLPTPRGWTHLLKRDPAVAEAIKERVKTPRPPSHATAGEGGSKSSEFTLSSAPRPRAASKNPRSNPYASNARPAAAAKTPAAASSSSLPPPSAARTARSSRSKPRAHRHLVCAVSENLARETCVASLDAGRPTYLRVTKQGNGQTYAETLSLLRALGPDEVLLNEGRRNSQLATKVAALFGHRMAEGTDAQLVAPTPAARKKKKARSNAAARTSRGRKSRFAGRGGDVDDDLTAGLSSGDAPETVAVVKFVPRSYFDQTKGAEVLRKLAREDTYDASLVEEYILLSSSHAVLQYAQLCLGAGLTRGSLSLDVDVGGKHRMNIDRATMANLELLVNAKTGRTAHSLVGTVDCTKTSVGGRLLRTNLMAPPTRIDTINARLDLVDSLLEDEEFFYAVMEHLEDLPDVDKMLSYVALTPRRRYDRGGNGALFGNAGRGVVTARVASKGISALVCIKSTLSVVPSFAHVLEVQLKELDEREGAGSGAAAQGRNREEGDAERRRRDRRQDGDGEEGDGESKGDESTTVIESEASQNEDGSNAFGDTSDTVANGGVTTATQSSSLDIGLGMNSTSNNSGNGNVAGMSSHQQSRHQLLRAILIAMKVNTDFKNCHRCFVLHCILADIKQILVKQYYM